ncbi:XRE family transcriptional regulator [Rhizobium sp. ARZ01]|uniref:XRE family transcriptional regulator n=1 Tax=Rhizobium sp. ARZ01 TaxID=2769313 RepID=UPI00178277AA|nr:XRE family transcriptional regulator [Rhizobium sp. ARZ01]MBD9373452.1 XRE family transcriptional regulator [Rhizobium sp. ARZ01]
MKPFNATRLSIARQRRLLNKKGFADLIGVTAQTVTRWELGAVIPTAENITAFSKALGFPETFFYGADLGIASPELVSFRSQKAMTAAVRDAALAAGSIGFLISDWVDQRFELSEIHVPDLSALDPETAAIMLRQQWSIGEQPISNMIHLLESNGVRVFSLAENSTRVNAFSLWRDEKPYVFLNTMKTAESSRFDAAHELGHLVLHQDGKTTGRKAEEEANQFASALLMPRADLLAHGMRTISSLNQLITAKKRWKVSVAALSYRIHKLGYISDWKYRDFCIQIATRFKRSEPDGIEREQSVVWRRVMRSLWAEKVTQFDIARELDVPVEEIDTLVFGIVNQPLAAIPTQRSTLKLVSG